MIARRADILISADALRGYTQKADAAKAAYDAAVGAAQGTSDTAGLQALADWGAKMQALLDRPDRNPLFDDYKTWLAQRGGWGSDLASAAAAQAEWAKAAASLVYARGRTLRVQKFVELVEAAKIEPFTPYARDNWPIRPGEFYAEAYSIWLSDPEFLETNYKVLFDFFSSGDFR